MIDVNDFEEGTLESMLTQVQSWMNDKASLKVEIAKLFIEFDKDENEKIDRRELRHFLTNLFEMLHIKLPINHDFIEYTFRQIDFKKTGSINLDAMQRFAKKFNKKLVGQAQLALSKLKEHKHLHKPDPKRQIETQ